MPFKIPGTGASVPADIHIIFFG